MTFLIALAALAMVMPQRATEKPWRIKREIPGWVKSEFRLGYYDRTYALNEKLYPEVLRGDFNGDGKPDFAVQVKRRSTGKFGIAVFQGKRTQSRPAAVFIVGAGKSFERNDVALDWVDIWSVYSKTEAYREIPAAKLPRLAGDVLKLQSSKGRSGFMYWTGTGYAWYPLPQARK